MSDARKAAEEALRIRRLDSGEPDAVRWANLIRCEDALADLLAEQPEATNDDGDEKCASAPLEDARTITVRVTRVEHPSPLSWVAPEEEESSPAPSPARDEVREAAEAFLEAEAAAWRTTGRPLPGDDYLAATYDARRRRLLAALSRDHAPDAE